MKVKFYGFLVFMSIWILFCALNDYWIKIESSSYLMMYGFWAGAFATFAEERLVEWLKGDSDE